MHLHKVIPSGAGLGGGSADAAFTLLLLNDKFQLGLSSQQLESYALELGSDCPFFISNQPSLAFGRGEVLKHLSLDLSSYRIAVIHPGIHISTPWAFSKIKPRKDRQPLQEVIKKPVTDWAASLVNDFEPVVFQEYPAIERIKEQLYASGAVYASLSGSGSSVFGLFNKEVSIEEASFPPGYFIRMV
jgi:4-diphosphocytidyl-2-C-methyl-D-erythritol kinase